MKDAISGQFLHRLWNQQRYFGIGPNSIRKTSMNCMIGIEIRPVYMTPSSKRWKIVLKRIRNKLHHLHRLLIITCLRSYMMCRHLLYSIMLQRAMGIRQEKSGKLVTRPNVIALNLSAPQQNKPCIAKICKSCHQLHLRILKNMNLTCWKFKVYFEPCDVTDVWKSKCWCVFNHQWVRVIIQRQFFCHVLSQCHLKIY